MMDRRSFLKVIGIGAAAIAAAPVLSKVSWEPDGSGFGIFQALKDSQDRYNHDRSVLIQNINPFSIIADPEDRFIIRSQWVKVDQLSKTLLAQMEDARKQIIKCSCIPKEYLGGEEPTGNNNSRRTWRENEGKVHIMFKNKRKKHIKMVKKKREEMLNESYFR